MYKQSVDAIGRYRPQQTREDWMGLKMIGQLHQNKSINEVPVIVGAISKVDFYSRHCSDRTNVM